MTLKKDLALFHKPTLMECQSMFLQTNLHAAIASLTFQKESSLSVNTAADIQVFLSQDIIVVSVHGATRSQLWLLRIPSDIMRLCLTVPPKTMSGSQLILESLSTLERRKPWKRTARTFYISWGLIVFKNFLSKNQKRASGIL